MFQGKVRAKKRLSRWLWLENKTFYSPTFATNGRSDYLLNSFAYAGWQMLSRGAIMVGPWAQFARGEPGGPRQTNGDYQRSSLGWRVDLDLRLCNYFALVPSVTMSRYSVVQNLPGAAHSVTSDGRLNELIATLQMIVRY